MWRMDENQLAKKIFKYILGLKATTKWLEEVERDAVESELNSRCHQQKKGA